MRCSACRRWLRQPSRSIASGLVVGFRQSGAARDDPCRNPAGAGGDRLTRAAGCRAGCARAGDGSAPGCGRARPGSRPSRSAASGIVSPWNYPILLSLLPIVDALAAGNRVLLKPSEHTPSCSALLAELIGSRFGAERACRGHRRCGDRPPLLRPAVRPPAVHRIHRRRAQRHAGDSGRHGPGDAGTRRQVAGDPLRRCRRRCAIAATHRAQSRRRQVLQCRPDLPRTRLRADPRATAWPKPQRRCAARRRASIRPSPTIPTTRR